jgi:hypothetical protein
MFASKVMSEVLPKDTRLGAHIVRVLSAVI